MGFEWFWSFFHILSMCDRLLVLELFGKKKSRMWRTKEPDQCHPTPWVLSAAGQVRTQVGAEERWVRCREGQWTERSQNSGDAKETSAGFSWNGGIPKNQPKFVFISWKTHGSNVQTVWVARILWKPHIVDDGTEGYPMVPNSTSVPVQSHAWTRCQLWRLKGSSNAGTVRHLVHCQRSTTWWWSQWSFRQHTRIQWCVWAGGL